MRVLRRKGSGHVELSVVENGSFVLDTLKRAFLATLLVAGFQEISDTILAVTTAIADRISDMNGWDVFFQMAQTKAKSYTNGASVLILGFNDLVIALLSYASYVGVYIARYVTVATYHFMWIFLSILSPLLILMTLFRGTSQITVNLFKSLIEVACWRIVWAVMSVMREIAESWGFEGRSIAT
jgi:type IV secretory pathway VirB6-like protein